MKTPQNRKEDVDSAIKAPSAKNIVSPGLILPSNSKFEDLIRILYNHSEIGVIIMETGNNPENAADFYIITKDNIVEFLYNRNKFMKARQKALQGNYNHFHNGNKNVIDIFNVPLSSLMQGPMEIFDEDLSIDELIRIMTEKGIETALIGKENQPSGIISLYDILAWNNKYFGPADPLILLVMDNNTGIIIARHDFVNEVYHSEPAPDSRAYFGFFNETLIDLYGAAIQSVDAITEEVIAGSGKMKMLEKENYTVLMEPTREHTGLLICTNNNILLRRKLIKFMKSFENFYRSKASEQNAIGVNIEVNISELIENW